MSEHEKVRIAATLVGNDPSVVYSFNYLFSVIMNASFDVVEDAATARQRCAKLLQRDIVFLNANRPDDPLLDLISRLKADKGGPVVMVLQEPGSSIGVDAFVRGADDVVDWPPSLHEFGLRIWRRLHLKMDHAVLSRKDLAWETEAYIAEQAGLTTAEAQVMRQLYARAGEIVTRDELSQALDGRPWRYGDRKFDVHVGKIRKKLLDTFGPGLTVSTIRSAGYCFSSDRPNFFSQKISA